jgi:hypothetical protein
MSAIFEIYDSNGDSIACQDLERMTKSTSWFLVGENA